MKKMIFLFIFIFNISAEKNDSKKTPPGRSLIVKTKSEISINSKSKDVFAKNGLAVIVGDKEILVSNSFLVESNKVEVEFDGKFFAGIVFARDLKNDVALIFVPDLPVLEKNNFSYIKNCFSPVISFLYYNNEKFLKSNTGVNFLKNSLSVKSFHGSNFEYINMNNVLYMESAFNKNVNGFLFDKNLNIVGMISPAFDFLDYSGMLFSISGDSLKESAEELINYGAIHELSLGIKIKKISTKQSKNLGVDENSAMVVSSKNKNFKVGDIITSINGKKCNFEEVDLNLPRSVEVEVLNAKKEIEVKQVNLIKKTCKLSSFKSNFFDIELVFLDNKDNIEKNKKNHFVVRKIGDLEDQLELQDGDILIDFACQHEFDFFIYKSLKKNDSTVKVRIIRNKKPETVVLRIDNLIKEDNNV